MNYLVLLCAFVSFLAVWISTPRLIRYLWRIDLVVKDQNKEGTPLVPISGGLAVLSGIFAGLLLYIFIRTFFFQASYSLLALPSNLLLILAGMNSILIVTLVGFLDDIIIKRSKESSAGLKQWQKPLLTLTAAIPLMVVHAGQTTISLPFIGHVHFGLLYPLFLLPLGFVGASNMVNILAGFNGMETGMALVYFGMLGFYAYTHGRLIGALFAVVTFAALLAFFYYNWVPAKILPGDSLTYLLGGVLATVAILGDMERAVIISSIPFFIEFILKARSKFKAQSYGYFKDGTIHKRAPGIYSIPHFFTKTGKFTERQIVFFMLLIQFIFSSLIWFV
ncbi:hypothetical protein HZB00_00900 [Candidatus Woesearchaeota archaeon]|nr:hypothetical protein [Candidatus Woesearchaeota archaeon]